MQQKKKKKKKKKKDRERQALGLAGVGPRPVQVFLLLADSLEKEISRVTDTRKCVTKCVRNCVFDLRLHSASLNGFVGMKSASATSHAQRRRAVAIPGRTSAGDSGITGRPAIDAAERLRRQVDKAGENGG